jgi:hypothetical protein
MEKKQSAARGRASSLEWLNVPTPVETGVVISANTIAVDCVKI